MTKVYLIRHGEAEGNVYRRAHGWYDGRITANGLRQIDALSQRFRDIPVDALYSSDLSRTRTTAGAITRYHNVPLELEPRLREIHMGEWEDVPWGNLSWLYPQAMAAFNDDPDRWRAPGAETFPQLRERMRAAVLELASRHDGQTIVCVSHGMAIRSLISGLLNVPSNEIYKVPHGDNTAVSLLEVSGDEINVVFYNDSSHLGEKLSTFAKQSWWRRAGSTDAGNLRFEPLDPNTEPELYTKLYSEAWSAVHGTLDGFAPELYLMSAKRRWRQSPQSILKALKGSCVVGMTELDTARGAGEGFGWISLCYVVAEERRRMLGVQLLGHAVSVYRAMGRSAIRLNVFEGNSSAIAFYEEYGFKPIGTDSGVFGPLLLMEKDIR